VVNWDIARYLRDELLARNVNTQMARYPEADESAGPSGSARWQEAAKYFIQALGVPGRHLELRRRRLRTRYQFTPVLCELDRCRRLDLSS
jgi:hypothetical protein